MKDKSKRQAYDLIHPSVARGREAVNEAAQIVALQKSKRERDARWQTRENAFDSSIFELQRTIRRLRQEIQNLVSIAAAEAAAEAQKNSWTTWLLSPITKKEVETEEETTRKDIARQERKMNKDMNERRLVSTRADLQREETRSRMAKEEVDAANLDDDRKIRVIQARLSAIETRKRLEREKAERERMRKVWKEEQEQWQKLQREAAEALRKQQAEARAAKQKQYAQATRQAYASTCRHDGWWPKVQGRTACPECDEVWTYLLQCPHCQMKACPRCQYTIRPRNAARTNRPAPSRMRPTRPNFDYDF